MVTVGMNYEVVSGKEETFEKAFHAVLNVMKTMPGHTSSSLYRNVDAKGNYLIISEWADEGDFDRFVKSDQFAKVTTWGKEQILTSRPRHQIFKH